MTWRTWAVPACLLIVLLAAGFRNRLQQNCSPRLLLLTALAWRRAGAWCWGPAVLLRLLAPLAHQPTAAPGASGRETEQGKGLESACCSRGELLSQPAEILEVFPGAEGVKAGAAAAG